MDSARGLSPKVSIIMNCLNNEKYLGEAIDSVYAQTFKDWEIILWDDASTDKSPDIAKSYDNRLKYFRSEKTLPLGHVRNLALGKAAGSYVAFLDCDDIWLPRKLERQVAFLEGHPDAGFLYSNYFLMKGGRKILVLRKHEPQGHVFENFLYHYPIAILTAVIRKKALEGLNGLFDEDLSLAEDFDFFMRVLYKSKAIYQAEPMAVYRVHSDMNTVKLIDKWPGEMKRVLKKFEKLCEKSEKNHLTALRRRKLDLSYLSAKICIKRGDLRSARKKVTRIRFLDLKYFLLYVISYMPARFWNFVSMRFMKNPF